MHRLRELHDNNRNAARLKNDNDNYETIGSENSHSFDSDDNTIIVINAMDVSALYDEEQNSIHAVTEFDWMFQLEDQNLEENLGDDDNGSIALHYSNTHSITMESTIEEEDDQLVPDLVEETRTCENLVGYMLFILG